MSQTGNRAKGEIPRRSMVKFFVIGGLLLVSPLLIVMNWPSEGCSAGHENFCAGSEIYKISITLLPYAMIIGGLIIGYNMKRISDAINAKDKQEEEGDEDGERDSPN